MARKSIISLLLAALLLFSFSTAFAHESQDLHDKDLKSVLFGNENKQLDRKENQDKAFKAISDAAALSIDQFSPNDTLQWKKGEFGKLQENLSSMGLPKLSISFEDVDLSIKVTGKNVTANSHRKYTHLGWYYDKYEEPEFWKRRKQILRDTVNRVIFYNEGLLSKLPWVSDVLYAPSEQCDAFCALVYSVHILGDHVSGDVPEKLTDIEPLIQYRNLSTPGIVAELRECFEVLFESQTGSWTYMLLEQELDSFCIKAEANCGTWGSIDTAEKCKINQEYAKELLKILSEHVPTLLQREEFFKDRFK